MLCHYLRTFPQNTETGQEFGSSMWVQSPVQHFSQFFPSYNLIILQIQIHSEISPLHSFYNYHRAIKLVWNGTFYWSNCTKPGKWLVMCVRCTNFTSFYDSSCLYFGCGIFVVFFILSLHIIYIVNCLYIVWRFRHCFVDLVHCRSDFYIPQKSTMDMMMIVRYVVLPSTSCVWKSRSFLLACFHCISIQNKTF